MMQRCRAALPALCLAALLWATGVLTNAFVSAPTPKLQSRTITKASGDDGGFLKVTKVEDELELSPEEFKMVLEAEIEAQRRKYYVGGVVKPNNLVVPWKPVEEKQLEKDARKQLKKNGIKDPEAVEDEDDKDSEVDIFIVGEQDVRLEWIGGAPGMKVGYIIERKRQSETQFTEIANYEALNTLLVQSFSGHNYDYQEQLVPPGAYTYRVLLRYRNGEIGVVGQKDVIVNQPPGLNPWSAVGFLVALFAFGFAGYFRDTLKP